MGFDLLGSLDPQRPMPQDTAPHTSAAAPEAVCSRRGCSRPAQWTLRWNNPRVHTPERLKAWLACDEHRGHLADFLGQRGFLKTITPFRTPDDTARDETARDDSPRDITASHAAQEPTSRTSPTERTRGDSPGEPSAGEDRTRLGDGAVVPPRESGSTH